MLTDHTTYRFEHAYGPRGWQSPGYLRVEANGSIGAFTGEPPDDETSVTSMDGFALPGMPNLHSHTYNRALAGFSEPVGGTSSNFWTWRERMYDLALALQPEELEAIAAQAFVEMLEGGFTSVAEFHYLHNQPDGSHYANRIELAERIVAAASGTGIRLTLLPALYTHGGIGAPLSPRQRRFGSTSVSDFMELFLAIRARCESSELMRSGVAPHSIRAVSQQELRELLNVLPSDVPVHIHLAEQTAEVDESLAKYGERPGDWLGHHFELTARWTLIHATHCRDGELATIARSGATVGLCPLTEAHLGDGRFLLPEFEAAGGGWGIGTDSNTAIAVGAELQALEYSQRVALQRRAIHPTGDVRIGELLYSSALRGGARALDQPIGRLEAGQWADLAVFSSDSVALVGHGPETMLDALVVGGARVLPSHVMVGGRWLVVDGHHVLEDPVQRRYAQVINSLRKRLR